MATTATPTTPTSFVASRTTTSSGTAECTTAVPGKYGHVDDHSACNAYWTYNPSFEAAVLFCVLFGLQTIVHTLQAYRYKKRYCWVLIMGILWELGSFIARAVGTRRQQELSLVVVSQLLFLLAPLWTNAFAYMTLGRLIYYFHPQKRTFGIKAISITKYFVWADVISFIIQGAGGSMLNPDNSPKAQKIGLKMYMGGVGLQEFFIVIFTTLGIKFQMDMKRLEAQGQAYLDRRGWKGQMYTMYAVLTFITIRIIFRLVEYARGTDPSNPILYHEGYIYGLDALPMFIAILLLNVFHPGRVLVGTESEFPRLSRKQKKELKRAKKEEKRRIKEEKRMAKDKRKGRYTGSDYALQEIDTVTDTDRRRGQDSREPWV